MPSRQLKMLKTQIQLFFKSLFGCFELKNIIFIAASLILLITFLAASHIVFLFTYDVLLTLGEVVWPMV